MADEINTKMITLIASGGQHIKVPEVAAKQSKTLYGMMAVDDFAMTNFPLFNIDSKTLAKVMAYCVKHAAEEPSKLGQIAAAGEGSSATRSISAAKASDDGDLREWDKEYMNVDVDALFNIIIAAHYLDIAELLHLAVQTVADMIRGKTAYEIRRILNIKSDFSREEEENYKNMWVLDE